MTYQGVVGRIREDSKRKVMAAWSLYGKGYIDRARFEQLTVAILGQAGAQAASAADLAVSLEMSRINKRMEALAGVDASKKRITYLDSVRTILDDENGDTVMQLGRLSLNAPLEAAQNAYGDALSSSNAEGYIRQLDADPCQLCRWWWREGRVWPKDHAMPYHSGCECIARPVTVSKPPTKVSY